jgi:hypothetical protein
MAYWLFRGFQNLKKPLKNVRREPGPPKKTIKIILKYYGMATPYGLNREAGLLFVSLKQALSFFIKWRYIHIQKFEQFWTHVHIYVGEGVHTYVEGM